MTSWNTGTGKNSGHRIRDSGFGKRDTGLGIRGSCAGASRELEPCGRKMAFVGGQDQR
jgi:hypothetical protein